MIPGNTRGIVDGLAVIVSKSVMSTKGGSSKYE